MNKRIEVFTKGRGLGSPFMTLWDEESILFFFNSVLADNESFPEGEQFTLVSFPEEATLHSGTGLYTKINGKIKVEKETGAQIGLLQRIGFTRILEE